VASGWPHTGVPLRGGHGGSVAALSVYRKPAAGLRPSAAATVNVHRHLEERPRACGIVDPREGTPSLQALAEHSEKFSSKKAAALQVQPCRVCSAINARIASSLATPAAELSLHHAWSAQLLVLGFCLIFLLALATILGEAERERD
jgi:hypothetical protein